MNIRLDNIRPEYILPGRIESSEIWGADVELDAGSCIMIHAPSGSGKTTLIQILYGLHAKYTGKVDLEGKALADFTISEKAGLRQKRFSVVFQDLRLFMKATGWENIQLNSALSPVHSESELRDMAAALGMADKLDRPVSTLSQGERQRIAIVRSLAQPFEWIFLDEPFSHLDENNIAKARELILNAAKERSAGILLAGLGYDYGFPAIKTLEL